MDLSKLRHFNSLSKLITLFKVQIALLGQEEGKGLVKNMKKKEEIQGIEEIWEGVEMCDCSDPICGCDAIHSEISALRYALYFYWAQRIKPISKVTVPEFENLYGKWEDRKSWRNFVMDVFSHNNLKALEIIDAYELNR